MTARSRAALLVVRVACAALGAGSGGCYDADFDNPRFANGKDGRDRVDVVCATGFHGDGAGGCVEETKCARGFVLADDGRCVAAVQVRDASAQGLGGALVAPGVVLLDPKLEPATTVCADGVCLTAEVVP